MSEYLIQDTTLTNIADAIRSKTGDTAMIPVVDWVEKIRGLSSAKVFIADHLSHNNTKGDNLSTSSAYVLQMQFIYPMPEWTPDIIYLDYEYKIGGYTTTYPNQTYFRKNHGRAYINYYSRAACYTLNDAYGADSVSGNIKTYYDPKYVSAEIDCTFSDCPHANAQNDPTITLTELKYSSGARFTSVTSEQIDAKIIAIKF